MRPKSILTILTPVVVIVLISCNYVSEQPNSKREPHIKALMVKYDDGKAIFNKHCVACHSSPDKEKSDQYAFIGLFERLPSPPEDYLAKFLLDSKQLIISGNKYAIAVHKAFSSNYLHEFKNNLSGADIDNLIVYIRVAVKQRR